jgi:hypothetical protein
VDKTTINGVELTLMPPVTTDDEWADYGQYLFPINSKRWFCPVGKLRESEVWLKRLGDSWNPNKSE